MKIATYQILLSLLASRVSASGLRVRALQETFGGGDKCADETRENFCDCAVCEDYTTDPVTGIGSVTINIGGCNKKSVSWMCCAGSNGDANGLCAVDSNSDKPNKREGTGVIKVTDIPAGAADVVVQIHDGQNAGEVIPDGVSGYCAGNAGGPCNDGLCERTIDLSTCGHGGGAGGDPHIKTFSGEYFDFHGECDLNLLEAPLFDAKQNLDIHIRTKIQYWYSFIEAAAVRIGEDVFEVGSWGEYSHNGVEGAMGADGVNPPSIGGYPVYHRHVSREKNVFDIVIGKNENITLSHFKSWVNVNVKNAQLTQVNGLMGTIEGKMLTHNGVDLHDDANAFAQDWQIKADDAKLFRSHRAPQWPEQCRLPDPKAAEGRRLEEMTVSEEAASLACAHKSGDEFDFCVYDVLATQDVEMAKADAGAF